MSTKKETTNTRRSTKSCRWSIKAEAEWLAGRLINTSLDTDWKIESSTPERALKVKAKLRNMAKRLMGF